MSYCLFPTYLVVVLRVCVGFVCCIFGYCFGRFSILDACCVRFCLGLLCHCACWLLFLWFHTYSLSPHTSFPVMNRRVHFITFVVLYTHFGCHYWYLRQQEDVNIHDGGIALCCAIASRVCTARVSTWC